MHWYGNDWWWSHMGWMMVLWAVGGVLLVVLTLFVVRTLSADLRRPMRPEAPAPREDDAERILRRRYASGEIDEQELHRRLDELRSVS